MTATASAGATGDESTPPGRAPRSRPAVPAPNASRRGLLAATPLWLLGARPARAAGAVPAVLQGIALVDQRSRPVAEDWLRGHALLLNFVYAGCSTSCPLQVRALAAMLEGLAPAVRERLHTLSVTVDPEHDTPAALAAFARQMGAEQPGWRFATGAPAQVQRLVERMQAFDSRRTGAPPRPEDHRTSLYLYRPDGALLQRYAGLPLDAPRLRAEITALVAAA